MLLAPRIMQMGATLNQRMPFRNFATMNARKASLLLVALGLIGCSAEDSSQSLSGLDVSHYQGNINWAEVSQSNVSFAYIKASEGETVQDATFAENWQCTAAEKITNGGYHVFTPGDSGIKQAKNFLDSLDSADIDYHGALPPALDIEQIPQDKLEIAKPEIRSWLIYVHKHLKCKPIIYTSPGTWNGEYPGDFTRYPLWLALYESDPAQEPSRLPDGWSDWVFWQFSNTGHFKGISANTDEDYFNGNAHDLLLTTCIAW